MVSIRTRTLAALFLLAVVAALGLSLRPSPARAQEGYTAIHAYDDFFGPEVVRVPIGGTVQWRMDGGNPHTVTADDGSFASGNLDPGADFERTFEGEGAFAYFCEYHGAAGGVGMSGFVLVGEAALPTAEGGVGPGREPVPTGPAPTIRVPQDAATIQAAVDAAEPGGLVLISPGVYHEAVQVLTPYLTIRGTDRNAVILEGDLERPNGIQVIEADGVAVENMTARNYLLNGFYWTGVHGYRGSYLTAYNNGDYGLYAFDSDHGRFELSYASGHPDSGFYIGQCDPCHAVITDVLAEGNALGYSGTNASGELFIVNSVWRYNKAGIVPNTLDSELLPPQHDAVIAGNLVHDNDNPGAPAKAGTYPAAGNGIVLTGTRGNAVFHNLVEDHPAFGIVVVGNIDQHLWITESNEVRENLVRRSGRADLALGAPAGGGDCFQGNDYGTSLPIAIQLTAGCGFTLNPWGGGELGVTFGPLMRYVESQSGSFPSGDWRTQPEPPAQRSMPDAEAAPPDPAIPEVSVPGVFEINDARTGETTAGGAAAIDGDPYALDHDVNPEVTVFGIPLAASWWQLLLGVYGYVLPFVLVGAWITIALWDLLRRAELTNRQRIGWMAVIMLVPFVGPLLYFGFGRSAIPAPMRWTLTAGGLGAYLLFAVLGVLFGAG